MKTDEVKLSQVKLNADNPRTITSDKLQKLINSIIVFPKMLDIRPVVVDNTMVALGGNMRINALKEIAKMTPQQLGERLATLNDYTSKTDGEKDHLIDFWGHWLEKPSVQIIRANELSEEERKQFIIKDNVSFGQWDYDMLANNWDTDMLTDWGMDTSFFGTNSDADIDSLFDGGRNGGDTPKEKIEIILPENLIEKKDELKDLITEALSNYPELTIK